MSFMGIIKVPLGPFPGPEANLTYFKSDFPSYFAVVLLRRVTLVILWELVLTVQGHFLIFERFSHSQPQAVRASSDPLHECKTKKHLYSIPDTPCL